MGDNAEYDSKFQSPWLRFVALIFVEYGEFLFSMADFSESLRSFERARYLQDRICSANSNSGNVRIEAFIAGCRHSLNLPFDLDFAASGRRVQQQKQLLQLVQKNCGADFVLEGVNANNQTPKVALRQLELNLEEKKECRLAMLAMLAVVDRMLSFAYLCMSAEMYLLLRLRHMLTLLDPLALGLLFEQCFGSAENAQAERFRLLLSEIRNMRIWQPGLRLASMYLESGFDPL